MVNGRQRGFELAFSRPVAISGGYTLSIVISELLLVHISVILGVISHAVVLFALLYHFSISEGRPYHKTLLALALLPLMRILSLTMPIQELPQVYWYGLVGFPVLAAIVLAFQALRLSRIDLGLRRPSGWESILVVASGLPLGLASYWILDPEPLYSAFHWPDALLGSLILIVFVAFPEEIMFRGLLQHTTRDLFGDFNVALGSIAFACMYLGTMVWGYVAFAGLVGLFFGWHVKRTGSLWGVIVSHSVISIETYLILPFLLR